MFVLLSQNGRAENDLIRRCNVIYDVLACPPAHPPTPRAFSIPWLIPFRCQLCTYIAESLLCTHANDARVYDIWSEKSAIKIGGNVCRLVQLACQGSVRTVGRAEGQPGLTAEAPPHRLPVQGLTRLPVQVTRAKEELADAEQRAHGPEAAKARREAEPVASVQLSGFVAPNGGKGAELANGLYMRAGTHKGWLVELRTSSISVPQPSVAMTHAHLG